MFYLSNCKKEGWDDVLCKRILIFIVGWSTINKIKDKGEALSRR